MGVAALPVALMAAGGSTLGLMRQGGALGQMSTAENTQRTLQLATQERERQDLLQKTLARQNVRNAAVGVDAASGSALGLANAAKAQTDRALSLLYAYDDLAYPRQTASGNGNSLNSGLATAQSLINLGKSGVSLFSSIWK